MLRNFMFVFLCCAAGLFAANPVITQTAPPLPASLSVFADQGDLTYCIATPSKTTPQLSLTCRRNGVTVLKPFSITDTISIGDGDIFWMFEYDKINPNLIHFSAATNVRDTQGFYLNSVLKTKGDALWITTVSTKRFSIKSLRFWRIFKKGKN